MPEQSSLATNVSATQGSTAPTAIVPIASAQGAPFPQAGLADPGFLARWLDVLDKANRLNLVPIVLAIWLAYLNWRQGEQAAKQLAEAALAADARSKIAAQQLAEAEARTRDAIAKCMEYRKGDKATKE